MQVIEILSQYQNFKRHHQNFRIKTKFSSLNWHKRFHWPSNFNQVKKKHLQHFFVFLND
jgi:hypothetical protein